MGDRYRKRTPLRGVGDSESVEAEEQELNFIKKRTPTDKTPGNRLFPSHPAYSKETGLADGVQLSPGRVKAGV
jgi:hypothetical protein